VTTPATDRTSRVGVRRGLRTTSLAFLLLASLSIVLVSCGGPDAVSGANPAKQLSQTAAFTRARSPFAYTLTLLTEDGAGVPYNQVTRGIYDSELDRAALEVVTIGEGLTNFTAATMIDKAARLLVVINGDEALIRVDIEGGDDGPWTPLDGPPGEGPTASGSIAILNAALVGDVTRVSQVGDIGATEIAGAATTQYRIPAPTTDVSPFLPTQVQSQLTNLGFGRDQVATNTTIDIWLDADGVTHRISIDYLPLITRLTSLGFSDGAEITHYQLVWEVEQFGDVVIDVPATDPS
jgi:hypothetical protein